MIQVYSRRSSFFKCLGFSSQVYLLSKDEGGSNKPLVSESSFIIFSKTWDATVFPHIMGKEMAMPGEDSQMLLQFKKPMALEKNQTFTIRQEGRTVGTGKVCSTSVICEYRVGDLWQMS